ncbi:MAG: GntR family transcriptional regulator, partial [Rhizobiales bacterium]|nr:GntR family transcriptional regulator [Hyphomicrobiales bacterium]
MSLEPGGGLLTARVMTVIRQRIANRSLIAGARLPSIRALARSQQVSTSTVADAYERLVAEGAIQ